MIELVTAILNSIEPIDIMAVATGGVFAWDIIDQQLRAEKRAEQEIARKLNKYRRQISFLKNENKQLIKGIRDMQEERKHEQTSTT